MREPDERKRSCPVLRGGSGSNAASLPDPQNRFPMGSLHRRFPVVVNVASIMACLCLWPCSRSRSCSWPDAVPDFHRQNLVRTSDVNRMFHREHGSKPAPFPSRWQAPDQRDYEQLHRRRLDFLPARLAIFHRAILRQSPRRRLIRPPIF